MQIRNFVNTIKGKELKVEIYFFSKVSKKKKKEIKHFALPIRYIFTCYVDFGFCSQMLKNP